MSEQERIESESAEEIEAHRKRAAADEAPAVDDDDSDDVEAHRKKL